MGTGGDRAGRFTWKKGWVVGGVGGRGGWGGAGGVGGVWGGGGHSSRNGKTQNIERKWRNGRYVLRSRREGERGEGGGAENRNLRLQKMER